MKLMDIILGINLLFIACSLFGQTNQAKRLYIPFLDEQSQSNVTVMVSNLNGQSCSMEYTNVISNTNFFTAAEQNLLVESAFKYKNLTTNSGPPGTVLSALYETNFVVAIAHRTNEEWVALFQYTNSQAQDEVTFLDPKTASVRFQSTTGNEYFINMRGDSILAFGQLKHGVANGFGVAFENNHLWLYQHSTNGMTIGKYFMWNPQNGNLVFQADFTQPYDMNKHRVNPYSH